MLAEDKAQADIQQTNPPPTPWWDIYGIPQEASSCLNVNALLEGKTIFNLTMARPPVFSMSSLPYENPFKISIFPTSPNLLGI